MPCSACRLLPDLDRFPLHGAHGDPPLTVSPVDDFPPLVPRPEGLLTVRVGPLPATLAARPVHGETDWQVGARDWPGEREALQAHLAGYPGLAGWSPRTPEGNPVGFEGDNQWVTAPVVLPVEAGASAVSGRELARRTVGLGGERYAFPGLRPGERPQHPFTVWWAVTFALSMLARYQPREWSALVSVDSSRDAVALEHLLTEALTVLPELLHRTVAEAAGSGLFVMPRFRSR